jgi:hypothetical protein
VRYDGLYSFIHFPISLHINHRTDEEKTALVVKTKNKAEHTHFFSQLTSDMKAWSWRNINIRWDDKEKERCLNKLKNIKQLGDE